MLYHRLALLIVAILLTLYFWGNSQPEAVGLVPPPWDKLAHLLWYAVLAGLLLLGLGRRAWPSVLAGTLLLAGWDEWHQFALPGRSPGIDDWLADALGVAVGIGISHTIGRRVGLRAADRGLTGRPRPLAQLQSASRARHAAAFWGIMKRCCWRGCSVLPGSLLAAVPSRALSA